MPPQMILPVLMLAAVLVGGAAVLRWDTRQRRIDRQMEIASLGGRAKAHPMAPPRPPQIRLQRQGDAWRRRFLSVVLGYRAEAPRFWSVSRVVTVGAAVGAAAFALGRLALPAWVALPAGLGVGTATVRALFIWQRERYADRLLRQLPDTIELVASAVRAGLPVSEAFRVVGREMPDPTREQFGHVAQEMALGRNPDEALFSLFERTRVAEYAMFAVTLSVQHKAGGRLAETVQTLADTVRQRVALAGRAKALAAEAKLSARVLSALPILSAVALTLERPGYLDPLLGDGRGRALLVFGIVSLVMGILTMRQMIKKGTTV